MIPSSNVLTAVDRGAQNQVLVTFSESMDQSILRFDMTDFRGGDPFAVAESRTFLGFTVSEDTTYDLSGFYNATDTGGPGEVALIASLYSPQLGTIYSSWQRSQQTPNAQLTLGETNGDFVNLLQGNPTGELFAGIDYQLSFDIYIYAVPDADQGASAVGNLTLKVGPDPVTAVPEPSSFLLFCIVVPCLLLSSFRSRLVSLR